jgi:hypothetical protein
MVFVNADKKVGTAVDADIYVGGQGRASRINDADTNVGARPDADTSVGHREDADVTVGGRERWGETTSPSGPTCVG